MKLPLEIFQGSEKSEKVGATEVLYGKQFLQEAPPPQLWVVALNTGIEGIPEIWLKSVESFEIQCSVESGKNKILI